MTTQPSRPPTHGAAAPTGTQIQQTQLKVMFAGLALTLALPAILVVVGSLLRQGDAAAVGAQPPQRILFYALLAVAASEIPAALILRKVMLKPLPTSDPGQAVPTTAYVFSRYLVMFNLAAACSVYGLVWYLLGGTLPEFALFAVIGLVIFRLVRPSTEFFHSLFGARPAIE
jgi:hypothetical protein